MAIAEKLAKTSKKPSTVIWDSALFLVIGGILGARVYHVIHYWNYYALFPLKIIMVWSGGLGIIGGLLGGFIALVIYFRWKKVKLADWVDIAAVVVPLGQAIGRLGNYFNREVFGVPTNLPWGWHIPYGLRPSQFLKSETFHPLFLYEAILNVLLFVGLYFGYLKLRTKLKKGTFVWIYLIGYSAIRFSLEFMRIEPWKIYGLNTAHIISILVFLVASFFLVLNYKEKL